MKRRILLRMALAGSLALHLTAHAAAAPMVEVYKNEGCGCCEAWIAHLKENGFAVKAHNVAETSAYRKKFGIPDQLGACHSAALQGYAIEGHVPAAEIKRLLTERPKATGLAVPAMPLGSPGMEGLRKDSYDILLVKADGGYTVYQHYSAK